MTRSFPIAAAVLLSMLPAASLADLPAAAGAAVAHWSMDEASGSRSDSVGSQTLTDNNTVLGGTGKFNNGADFERDTTEYLSRASSSTLQMGDVDFTIRAWVKLETLPPTGVDYMVVAKDVNTPANSRDYTLDISRTTYNPRFYVNGGGGGLVASWGSGLSTGTWYLIHAWHDASANELGISVNAGTPVTATTGGTAPETSAAEFRIGARAYAGAQGYFDGVIDDVVILKGHVMTSAERTADYNSGTGVAFSDWNPGGGSGSIPVLMHHYRGLR